MNNVIFCYPSMSIGGAQLLFIRCAKYLSSNSKFQVFYIDYKNGFARKELKEEKVTFINYIDEEKIQLLKNSILIAPLSYIDIVNSKFKLSQNNYFFFWSIHPMNIAGKIKRRDSFYFMTKKNRRRIGTLLKELSIIGVIKYMDYSNYLSASKVFSFNLNNIEYIPIPIDNNNIIDKNDIKKRNVLINKISFLWLSRLDSDKINTLLTFMNELEVSSKINSIVLYVVGDGTELVNLKRKSPKYNYDIVFLGKKHGNELDSFIDSNVDIGLAMGTSALEIAKRGKPVIVKGLLSKVHDAGKLNDYIFLHEEYGFSLGTPDKKDEFQANFQTKLNEVIRNYDEVAIKSYEYTIENHLLTSVSSKLIDAINKVVSYDNKTVYSKINKISDVFNHDRRFKILSIFRELKQMYYKL